MEPTYIYETHLHTKESSACSDCSAKDYIARYQRIGYSGIIVTDHFYHGNTAISHSLKWKDWVYQFCLGYEHAKEEGDKKGFQVFFGWEENFHGDEYLIYGLDKQWLYEHEEMLYWSHKKQLEEVRAGGGLVVQAHPYRERAYLHEINLHPNDVDAIEVANYGNLAYMDTLAYEYGKERNLPMIAGSDMHHLMNVSNECFGVAFHKKLNSIQDFITAVKSSKPVDLKQDNNSNNVSGYELIVPDNRFQTKKVPTLPVHIYE